MSYKKQIFQILQSFKQVGKEQDHKKAQSENVEKANKFV